MSKLKPLQRPCAPLGLAEGLATRDGGGVPVAQTSMQVAAVAHDVSQLHVTVPCCICAGGLRACKQKLDFGASTRYVRLLCAIVYILSLVL